MNIKHWLATTVKYLHYSYNPKYDAEILLSFVIKKNISWLTAFDDTILTENELLKLKLLVKRRARGEPIAYILGKQEFWSLPISLSSDTFIPRADTESLVEIALLHLSSRPCTILELGTGSGAISLAIAHERPDCKIFAVDYIKKALIIAKYNAKKLKFNNIEFFYSNWFSALKNISFDMIISNPPYISINDVHLLNKDLLFEPLTSLISNENGLGDIKKIIFNAKKFLNHYGYLFLEHGWKQASSVRNLLYKNQFKKIKTYKDYSGNNRITGGLNILV